MWVSGWLAFFSVLLIMLQAFKQTKLSWKVTLWSCFIMLGFSIANIIDKHEEQKYIIQSIEKIRGTIFWSESELTSAFANDKNELDVQRVSVQMKLYSEDVTVLPQGEMSYFSFYRQCKIDPRFGYGYLPPLVAKELFVIFAEQNGSIYDKKEEDAGVERFYFKGTGTNDSSYESTLVTHKLELGADANSQYTSLSDLNGTIMLAYINPGRQKAQSWPTSITWNIKTSGGHKILHFPLTHNLKRGPNEEYIYQFVGLCIPNAYFPNASHLL